MLGGEQREGEAEIEQGGAGRVTGARVVIEWRRGEQRGRKGKK